MNCKEHLLGLGVDKALQVMKEKGCKKRPQRAGIKNNLQYQSCGPSCYDGPYTDCPWNHQP